MTRNAPFHRSRTLYVLGEGNLRSVKVQGEFIDEGFVADSVVSSAGVAYALRKDELLARKPDETAWLPLRWFETIPGSKTPLSAGDTGLYVVRTTTDDFEILFVDRPELPDATFVTLTSMPGRAKHIRVVGNFVYALVYGDSSEAQDARNALYRRELVADAPIELLGTATDFWSDFAVDEKFVYLSREALVGHEIEVISVKDTAKRVRLGTQFGVRYPEAIDGRMWFFAYQRLRRVDLKIGEL